MGRLLSVQVDWLVSVGFSVQAGVGLRLFFMTLCGVSAEARILMPVFGLVSRSRVRWDLLILVFGVVADGFAAVGLEVLCAAAAQVRGFRRML